MSIDEDNQIVILKTITFNNIQIDKQPNPDETNEIITIGKGILIFYNISEPEAQPITTKRFLI